MWLVVGCLLVVHAGCYLAMVIFINKQKAFITDINAAGGWVGRDGAASRRRGVGVGGRFAWRAFFVCSRPAVQHWQHSTAPVMPMMPIDRSSHCTDGAHEDRRAHVQAHAQHGHAP